MNFIQYNNKSETIKYGTGPIPLLSTINYSMVNDKYLLKLNPSFPFDLLKKRPSLIRSYKTNKGLCLYQNLCH